MRRNYRRDTALHSLANEFESMNRGGGQVYFEDRHLFQLIGFYENEYSLEKAMEVTDFALEQYQYRVDFYIVKIRLLIKFAEYEAALNLLEQAENISPGEWELKMMKCRIYSKMKDYARALAYIKELCMIQSNEFDLIDLMLEEAFVYEKMKDFTQMYQVLKDILMIKPDHPDALEHIWMSVEICKNYNESIELHESLLDRNPYTYQAWYNLGHAYSCIGDYEKAIAALEYSFIINPEFEFGYKDCADLCFQVKNHQKALDVYSEYLEIFGPESEVLISLGQCYLSLNYYKEARSVLKKSSKLDPYNDEVYFYLGMCDLYQKRFSSSTLYFLKAIKIEDRREEYYAAIAEAYTALEEYEKSDYYYRKATETGPEQAEIWCNYAVFYLKLREYKEALKILDEAEYYTCSAELLYCRAAILILDSRREEGLAILHDALTDDLLACWQMFEWAPQLETDKDIKAIIDYISKE